MVLFWNTIKSEGLSTSVVRSEKEGEKITLICTSIEILLSMILRLGIKYWFKYNLF